MASIKDIEEKYNYDDSHQGQLYADEVNIVVGNLKQIIDEAGGDYTAFGEKELVYALNELRLKSVFKATGTNELTLENKYGKTNASYILNSSCIFKFQAEEDNTGEVEIKITGSALSKPLYKNGNSLEAGDIKAGMVYEIEHDKDNNCYNIISTYVDGIDTLGGVTADQYLRSDIDDKIYGKITQGDTDNRTAGLYGVYDSTKVSHIWSIGEAYYLNANGSDFGNLYGAAYYHSNNGTYGEMAGGHQFVWANNGTPTVSIGDSIWTANSLGIGTCNLFGALDNSKALILGDSGTGIRQNGTGVLEFFQDENIFLQANSNAIETPTPRTWRIGDIYNKLYLNLYKNEINFISPDTTIRMNLLDDGSAFNISQSDESGTDYKRLSWVKFDSTRGTDIWTYNGNEIATIDANLTFTVYDATISLKSQFTTAIGDVTLTNDALHRNQYLLFDYEANVDTNGYNFFIENIYNEAHYHNDAYSVTNVYNYPVLEEGNYNYIYGSMNITHLKNDSKVSDVIYCMRNDVYSFSSEQQNHTVCSYNRVLKSDTSVKDSGYIRATHNEIYITEADHDNGAADIVATYSKIYAGNNNNTFDSIIGTSSRIETNGEVTSNFNALFYGSYMENTILQNAWGIYIDSDTPNYFAGSVQIGTSSISSMDNSKALILGDSGTGIRQNGDGVLELFHDSNIFLQATGSNVNAKGHMWKFGQNDGSLYTIISNSNNIYLGTNDGIDVVEMELNNRDNCSGFIMRPSVNDSYKKTLEWVRDDSLRKTDIWIYNDNEIDTIRRDTAIGFSDEYRTFENKAVTITGDFTLTDDREHKVTYRFLNYEPIVDLNDKKLYAYNMYDNAYYNTSCYDVTNYMIYPKLNSGEYVYATSVRSVLYIKNDAKVTGAIYGTRNNVYLYSTSPQNNTIGVYNRVLKSDASVKDSGYIRAAYNEVYIVDSDHDNGAVDVAGTYSNIRTGSSENTFNTLYANYAKITSQDGVGSNRNALYYGIYDGPILPNSYGVYIDSNVPNYLRGSIYSGAEVGEYIMRYNGSDNSFSIRRVTNQGGLVYASDSIFMTHAGERIRTNVYLLDLATDLGFDTVEEITSEYNLVTADGNIVINPGLQADGAIAYRYEFTTDTMSIPKDIDFRNTSSRINTTGFFAMANNGIDRLIFDSTNNVYMYNDTTLTIGMEDDKRTTIRRNEITLKGASNNDLRIYLNLYDVDPIFEITPKDNSTSFSSLKWRNDGDNGDYWTINDKRILLEGDVVGSDSSVTDSGTLDYEFASDSSTAQSIIFNCDNGTVDISEDTIHNITYNFNSYSPDTTLNSNTLTVNAYKKYTKFATDLTAANTILNETVLEAMSCENVFGINNKLTIESDAQVYTETVATYSKIDLLTSSYDDGVFIGSKSEVIKSVNPSLSGKLWGAYNVVRVQDIADTGRNDAESIVGTVSSLDVQNPENIYTEAYGHSSRINITYDDANNIYALYEGRYETNTPSIAYNLYLPSTAFSYLGGPLTISYDARKENSYETMLSLSASSNASVITSLIGTQFTTTCLDFNEITNFYGSKVSLNKDPRSKHSGVLIGNDVLIDIDYFSKSDDDDNAYDNGADTISGFRSKIQIDSEYATSDILAGYMSTINIDSDSGDFGTAAMFYGNSTYSSNTSKIYGIYIDGNFPSYFGGEIIANNGIGTDTSTFSITLNDSYDSELILSSRRLKYMAGSIEPIIDVSYYDSFIGLNAGLNANILSYAIAIGYHALSYTGTSDAIQQFNTAVGAYAMGMMAPGVDGNDSSKNIAIGDYAFYSPTPEPTDSDNNRYVDAHYNNIAIGSNALKTPYFSQHNIAIGTNTMSKNSYYKDSVVIGHWSANTCLDLVECVFIGNDVGPEEEVTVTNSIAIGYQAGDGQGDFDILDDNQIIMGNANITSALCKVQWDTPSDLRDKTDIETLPSSLEFVKELRPISYVYDDRFRYEDRKPDGTKKDTIKHYGFGAQEVLEKELEYFGENVIVKDKNKERLIITETAMIPVLTKALQELDEKVEQQQKTISELLSVINDLTSRIEELENN